VLANWMGGPSVAEGQEELVRRGIPSFSFPDTAGRAFSYLWKYADNQRALYETPEDRSSLPGETRKEDVAEQLRQVRQTGRVILSELESKKILCAYGIPVSETVHAWTEEEAAQRATEMGFPVVLKLHSTTITHKADVQGVELNLRDRSEVGAAFERIKSAFE